MTLIKKTTEVINVNRLALIRRAQYQLKNIFLMMLLVPLSFVTYASDIKALMNISPEQCVAMSQGQSCYVAVELTWQVDVPGDYCLYSSAQENSLRCWSNVSEGQFTQAFNTKVNLTFHLKQQNATQPLVTSVVKMAWVHKKKGQPRTSWRLF